MTLNFGSFPTFLTSSLDINVFRLSAVISSKLFKLIVFPLFPSTVSAPCAWLFYGSSNNAGTLRAWPLCPLILEWDPFLNDRKSSCEVNSTLLVRVLKLRFCAVLRLKRWSQTGVSENDDNLWQLQSRVNGSNVGGAPSFINLRQTPEQSESVTTFCSDRFFLLVSSSLRSVSVHLTGNFHSNFYHKEKCVYWIKTFSSNVLHQDTVCISVFSVNRFKFRDAGKNWIQSLWKSWRSTFI